MRADQVHDSADCRSAAPHTIQVVSTEEGLATLETDWNRLSKISSNPNVFMTYDWYKAWSRLQPAGQGRQCLQPHVTVIRHRDSVVGIVPLLGREVSRFRFRVRKLEFVSDHADYNDLLLSDDPNAQINAIVEHLSAKQDEWDIIDLRKLREEGEGRSRIEQALARANLFYSILPEPEACPYLPIEAGSSDWTARLSGDSRRTLRQRMKKAAAEDLQTRIIENPHQEPGLLEALIELERKKRLQKSTRPFVGNYQDAFQSLFANLGPDGWLYVALLEQRGHPVAFQLGFRCGRKLWDYSKAYDPSFSRFAPGTLMLHALLDYALSKGFDEYDFLQGEEPYKMIWSTGCHRRYRLLIWNRRGASRVRKFLYHDVKKTIRRLLR
jgi:CelD/BcsL family acetyltransferase involved in cellulose biosynthesis